ncbi:hypothetical protein HDV06_002021 [Boothiomyces sp. JEL0866]|nr:hypothetical protein HDV06_002021 [Boothiomyces sp. JEL0866]
MRRAVNTCYGCQKKKQRCNRKRPSCQGCEISKTTCEYPPLLNKNTNQESEELHSVLIERITRLESSMKASNLFGFVNSHPYIIPAPPSSTVDPNEDMISQKEYFVLSENLFKMGQTMTNISKEFFGRHLANSSIYRQAIRAVYYFYHEGPDSIIQTYYWMDKAKLNFGQSLSKSCLGNILGCMLLHINSLKLGHVSEGLMYLNHAIRLGKDLGINNEESIQKLSDNERECEDIRNLWWLLATMDQHLIIHEKENIHVDDKHPYLPGTYNMQFTNELGVKIVSSRDWVTPSLRKLSLPAYRVILACHFGKALRYNLQYKDEIDSVDGVYVLSILDDSISIWYQNMPEEFFEKIKPLINNEIMIDDPQFTWMALDTLIQYHFIRILISSPLTYHMIEHDGSYNVTSATFTSILAASMHIAKILSFYLKSNPEFTYCNTFLMGYVFQAGVPLVCALKIDASHQSQYRECLQVVINALGIISQLQQRKSAAIDTLNHLLSLPTALDVVQCYRKLQYSSNPCSNFVPEAINSAC